MKTHDGYVEDGVERSALLLDSLELKSTVIIDGARQIRLREIVVCIYFTLKKDVSQAIR